VLQFFPTGIRPMSDLLLLRSCKFATGLYATAAHQTQAQNKICGEVQMHASTCCFAHMWRSTDARLDMLLCTLSIMLVIESPLHWQVGRKHIDIIGTSSPQCGTGRWYRTSTPMLENNHHCSLPVGGRRCTSWGACCSWRALKCRSPPWLARPSI